MQPFLKLADTFPVDPTNPMAIKTLVDIVKSGRIGMIFPEGRITVTGSLMMVYEGPGLIADKARAKILPIRIDGAQYSPFSRLKGKVRIRLFPKIVMTILPPHDFTSCPEGVLGPPSPAHGGGAALRHDVADDVRRERYRKIAVLGPGSRRAAFMAEAISSPRTRSASLFLTATSSCVLSCWED